MRFVDLFAGLGGFHAGLSRLGHECVFAVELDEELRTLYQKNFKVSTRRVGGDIRDVAHRIPKHDILCAGFPCQPFSKSGAQLGFADQTRGTLFHDVLAVVKRVRPHYVILENVGNFPRHDGGRTWTIVRESLEGLGYFVRGTEPRANGGHGLISPHHLGYPHHRERFFAVASLTPLPKDPFPPGLDSLRGDELRRTVRPKDELSLQERDESRLSGQQVACIEHWNRFIKAVPAAFDLPSFPIWGDEFGARYPFEGQVPQELSQAELRSLLRCDVAEAGASREQLLARLPRYATRSRDPFPDWKRDFIRANRAWYRRVEPHLPRAWAEDLLGFPPSLRKLEWNCKGEARNLWNHILQFRPSGLRVKRYTSVPALVAMTLTQVPILGPERRFIVRREALALQGFKASHRLPLRKEDAFRALGNAVHAGVVGQIATNLGL